MNAGMRRATAIGLVVLLAGGCWYHRVDVPNPVMHATKDSETVWGRLWRPVTIEPGASCPSGMFKEVVVRSNWGFSLIRLATLGLVAPARVERHCARAELIDPGVPPNTLPSAPPGGRTYVSVLYGAAQGENPRDCNNRGLASVKIRPNPFFDLVSVATVGLVSPVRLGWTCVPAASPSGGNAGGAP